MYVLSISRLHLTAVGDFELGKIVFAVGGEEGEGQGKRGKNSSKLSFLLLPPSFLPTPLNGLDVSYMP